MDENKKREAEKKRLGQPPSKPSGSPPDTTRNVRAGDTSRISGLVSTPAVPFPSLPVQFGRYRIEKFLGSGAMGEVYLAVDSKLGRKVAIKVPKASSSISPNQLRRMEIEARSLASIDNPHICKVFDFGDQDGIHFIAMEFIPGEELQDTLKRLGRKRKPKEAVRIISTLARALSTAHESGIIHRDLKPGNIRLRENGRLVIMDFGLARNSQVEDDGRKTLDGTVLGSAAYMPPEQGGGRVEDTDPRSDIYALGIMFFELLTGDWPFNGKAVEIIGQKSILDPPSPLTLAPELPPKLAEICLKMIARKQNDRYSSCRELLKDLKSVDLSAPPQTEKPPLGPNEGGLGPGPKEGSPGPDFPDFGADSGEEGGSGSKSRRKAKLSVISAARARLSQGVAWWKRQSWQVRGISVAGIFATVLLAGMFLPTANGVLRIEIEDPSISVQFDGQAITIENQGQPIKVSPNSSHTLEVQQNGMTVAGGSKEISLKRGEQRLLTVELIDGTVTVNGHPIEPPLAVASAGSAPGSRQSDSESTIEATSVLKGHTDSVEHLTFTPDGEFVISASNGDHHEMKNGTRYHVPGKDNSVRVWNVNNGKQVRMFRMETGYRYGPRGLSVSPDGKLLGVSSGWMSPNGDSEPRVYVWDLLTGARTNFFMVDKWAAIGRPQFSADGTEISAIRSEGFGIHRWSINKVANLPDVRLEMGPKGIDSSFVRWSTNGQYVLGAVSESTSLSAWNATTGKLAKTFTGHSAMPLCMALSTDGTRGLSCARDYTTRMWDWQTQKELYQIGDLNSLIVTSVAFSPSGKFFVVGTFEGQISLRETETGRLIAKLKGHNNRINDLVFSPEGNLLASAGKDQEVRLWKLPADNDMASLARIATSTPSGKTGDGIVNGDFSNGFIGWTQDPQTDFNVFPQWNGKAMTSYGRLGGASTGRLWQAFTVPEDAVSLDWYVFGSAGGTAFVEIRWRHHQMYQQEGNGSNTPSFVSWNLRPLRGKMVTLGIVDRDDKEHIGAHGFRIVRESSTTSAP